LNTQVLSHSARQTRLLWPLKLNHYLRQWSVFIWRNSQSVDSTFHAFVQWDPQTSYFKTLSGKSPNRQVQAYLKWPRCRCVNVLERNGNPPLQISLLEVCLPRWVQGLWLATFLCVVRELDLARLSPGAKRTKSDCRVTVTLGCPRWAAASLWCRGWYHQAIGSYRSSSDFSVLALWLASICSHNHLNIEGNLNSCHPKWIMPKTRQFLSATSFSPDTDEHIAPKSMRAANQRCCLPAHLK
jgi:hypothetical protein